MIPRDLPLPENCRVRLVDLPVQAGGAIAVSEDGFINIYLNARLSRDAQLRALQHELRHHYRGDLYSDRDIRMVERDADGRDPRTPAAAPAAGESGLLTVDGALLTGPVTGFDPQSLKRVGRGLYQPTGENRARAQAHIDMLRALLLEACGIYDVMQTPPLVSSEALSAPVVALGSEDIAFIAWQSAGQRPRAVMHFSRDGLYGALYCADDGAADNAVAVMLPGDFRVIVDIRRKGRRPAVHGIHREIGGRRERVY